MRAIQFYYKTRLKVSHHIDGERLSVVPDTTTQSVTTYCSTHLRGLRICNPNIHNEGQIDRHPDQVNLIIEGQKSDNEGYILC